MKMFTEKRNDERIMEERHMAYEHMAPGCHVPPYEHRGPGRHVPPHEHRGPGRHIPPHERKALMRIEFDEADWDMMYKVFGDEDTAQAAAAIIWDAPPEIQIVVVQLMNMIEEVA